MSSEARREAIDVVADYLNEATRGDDDGPGVLPTNAPTEIVDKLLETHTIIRRTIRRHRAASSERPGLRSLDL